MKKLATIAILLAGFSFSTFAQDSTAVRKEGRKGPRHARHDRQMDNKTPAEIATFKTDRLAKKLSFTDAQKKEVYTLQLNQAERKAVHLDKMKQLHQGWRAEMKTDSANLAKVLTPEQQKVLQEQKGEFSKKGKRDGRRRDGVRGGKASFRSVDDRAKEVKLDALEK